MFGSPTASLWVADAYRAPFLAVIYDNEEYAATHRAWTSGYPDATPTPAGEWLGASLSPAPEFSLLAQACRAYGERVDEPAELEPAIRRGMERIRAGQAAVIDVRLSRLA